MNLITLLGAAAACEQFCKLLFTDPIKGAQLLGLVLTETDVQALKDTLGKLDTKERKQICDHFQEIANMLCKHPPCPFIPVIPGQEDFCKAA
jgi:hypothetical protein